MLDSNDINTAKFGLPVRNSENFTEIPTHDCNVDDRSLSSLDLETQDNHLILSKNGTCKSRIDMRPPDKLLLLSQKQALQFQDAGESDKCINELVKCTTLSMIVYGANHWKVASSFANLAEAYYELKGYAPQALTHSETAKCIMLSGLHSSGTSRDKSDVLEVLLKIYLTTFQSLMDTKKINESEKALNKAKKTANELFQLPSVTEKTRNVTEIELAQHFARLYNKQKKWSLSQNQYELAAELMECQYGRDSIALIAIYKKLSQVEMKKGRVANKDRVLELMLQAHSVAAANYKAGSIEMVDTAMDVADAYVYLDNEDAYVSAESYMNECLAACVTQAGPQDDRTLHVQDRLARLFVATNRYNEASSLLHSGLKKKLDKWGKYSEQVSDTYKLLGSIYLAQGQINKCVEFYQKCYEIERLIFGINHSKSKDTLRNIDILRSSPSVAGNAALTKQEQLDRRPRFDSNCKIKH